MTNWQPITRPWPASYNSRTDVIFLCTEDWDYITTEDWDYIILEESYWITTEWTSRPAIT